MAERTKGGETKKREKPFDRIWKIAEANIEGNPKPRILETPGRKILVEQVTREGKRFAGICVMDAANQVLEQYSVPEDPNEDLLTFAFVEGQLVRVEQKESVGSLARFLENLLRASVIPD